MGEERCVVEEECVLGIEKTRLDVSEIGEASSSAGSMGEAGSTSSSRQRASFGTSKRTERNFFRKWWREKCSLKGAGGGRMGVSLNRGCDVSIGAGLLRNGLSANSNGNRDRVGAGGGSPNDVRSLVKGTV
jgi:hypothetical protein